MDVLVTGSSSGLGLGFVERYAARGDRVFATVRNPASADELRALAARQDGIEIVALDVGDPASIEESFAAVAARTDGLGLLLNNAGVWHPGVDYPLEPPPLGELTYEDGVTTFAVNAIGPLLVVQRYRELLADGAKLPFVSSASGSLTLKRDGGDYYYCASKAAVNMVVKTLANDGFLAVALSPGFVKTRMSGPHATLEIAESVEPLMALVDRLTPADAGRFLDRFGNDVPW